jgi:hypothetical protein
MLPALFEVAAVISACCAVAEASPAGAWPVPARAVPSVWPVRPDRLLGHRLLGVRHRRQVGLAEEAVVGGPVPGARLARLVRPVLDRVAEQPVRGRGVVVVHGG